MRTAVFDLDGTLAETAPDLIGAANDLLVEKGVSRREDWMSTKPPISPVADRRLAGRGGKALIALGYERVGAPIDRAAVDALFPTYLEIYRDRIDRETRLFDGVAPALSALEADGWRLCVCTNKPEALAVELLSRLAVGPRFAALIGADTLPVRKPDPAPVWAAIDRAGGERSGAVLIGDTRTDADAARAAGVPIVLTTFGYALEPIESLAPDASIDAFAALPETLGRLTADG